MDAPHNTKGGASAPSNVLPFPQSRSALRRRMRGMDAAGFLSLTILERNGEKFPENVQRFDEPDGPLVPDKSPALLLALLVWNELPESKRENIRRTIRRMAYGERPDENALRLLNMFNRRA